VDNLTINDNPFSGVNISGVNSTNSNFALTYYPYATTPTLTLYNASGLVYNPSTAVLAATNVMNFTPKWDFSGSQAISTNVLKNGLINNACGAADPHTFSMPTGVDFTTAMGGTSNLNAGYSTSLFVCNSLSGAITLSGNTGFTITGLPHKDSFTAKIVYNGLSAWSVYY
jgi:hypothetical protein